MTPKQPPRAYVVTTRPQVIADMEGIKALYLRRHGIHMETNQVLSMALRELAEKMGLKRLEETES